MKVFVYDKKSSKLVACITKVNCVKEDQNSIIFITDRGDIHKFNSRQVKSTTYQN